MRQNCECSDPGCVVQHGNVECNEVATGTLYRIDMQDETGVRFCDLCASDAMGSGVFTTQDED